MISLAIFVEGETEQLFVERFVREAAGDRNIKIKLGEALGGGRSRRRTRIIEATAEDIGVDYYVLIVDCHGDGGVRSRIGEEFGRLVARGFTAVIGLRDAPKGREKIPMLRAGLPQGIPIASMTVHFVIAVMEIEAWFLAEHTHFGKIDPSLTPELIRENLGFYPGVDDMREQNHPAQDMDAAYGLVGRRYHKGMGAQQTIALLDCAKIAFEMADGDEDLATFVRVIFDFLDFGREAADAANPG